MATCTRVLNALADCQRKHPREPYVCQHLQRAAAWCLFRQACPDEGGLGMRCRRGCRRGFACLECDWHAVERQTSSLWCLLASDILYFEMWPTHLACIPCS